MVPTLTTDRLTMRAWREQDAAPYAEMTSDPEVMRFMGGVLDPEQTWREVAVFVGHWELRGYGLWAVEREGALIGRVGLWQPGGWPGLEVGWLLARSAWGHGYATEAARASVDYAWRELGAEELISLIAPENVASQRVAERLGMRPRGEYAYAALIKPAVDGGAGNDTLQGSNGVDVLIGGDGTDLVDGNEGNDVAFLGAGEDVLVGADGDDTLRGGLGADVLMGGRGDDLLDGGDGDDIAFDTLGANTVVSATVVGSEWVKAHSRPLRGGGFVLELGGREIALPPDELEALAG